MPSHARAALRRRDAVGRAGALALSTLSMSACRRSRCSRSALSTPERLSRCRLRVLVTSLMTSRPCFPSRWNRPPVAFFALSFFELPESNAACDSIVLVTMAPAPLRAETVSVFAAPEPEMTSSHTGSPASCSAAAVASTGAARDLAPRLPGVAATLRAATTRAAAFTRPSGSSPYGTDNSRLTGQRGSLASSITGSAGRTARARPGSGRALATARAIVAGV